MQQLPRTQAVPAGASSPPPPPSDLPTVVRTTSASSAATSNSGKESSERPCTQPARSPDFGSLRTRLPIAQESRVKMPPSTSPAPMEPRSYADVVIQRNHPALQNRGGDASTDDTQGSGAVYANTLQRVPAPQVPAPVADTRFADAMPALRKPIRTRGKRAKGKSSSSVKDGEGGVQKSEAPRLDGGSTDQAMHAIVLWDFKRQASRSMR
ncbi:uncharacterized protein TRAVEDRAFT_20828 [Trametes versicolor FP-101664 SS1]|uniref:uncharacterized protein n=1 Tax=Trametes versicolor (strain FP-101664) TaxID=717944 RepID=UPI0004622D0A|nr:uncharacterized protein TRAVEDRAFT_20828 [Trametes versicolor FP-101664 SS1]EIW59036.1 hypothetical protein TRAVEDRAFT_20828 [Trametes versicolor FP-101664 SS1]